MTGSETAKVLGLLRAAYPNFYKDKSKEELESIVALWTDIFADDDVRVVAVAVKSLIASDEKGCPPHIGAVKEHIRKVLAPDDVGEAEAWAMIRRAVANGYYGYAEEYAKLPPMLQKLLGSATQLKDWAMMDSETFNSVVASNFRKWFTAAQMRQREQAKLPADVRSAIEGVADRFRLTEGQT